MLYGQKKVSLSSLDVIREGFQQSKWKFKMVFAMCHLPLQEADYFLNTQEFFGYRIAECQGFLVFFFKVKIKVIQLVFGLASLRTF